jgi:hypothetical protein
MEKLLNFSSLLNNYCLSGRTQSPSYSPAKRQPPLKPLGFYSQSLQYSLGCHKHSQALLALACHSAQSDINILDLAMGTLLF